MSNEQAICPNSNTCTNARYCSHSIPHTYKKSCSGIDYTCNIVCIPHKETPMEKRYELLKSISIASLEEAGACERELHRFAFLLGKYRAKEGGVMEGYDREIRLEDALEIVAQCEGGMQFLVGKGFIREKVGPFEIGDRVRVTDGSGAMQVESGKAIMETDHIGLGKNGPMEIVAICSGLPTKPHVAGGIREWTNDLVLRGQNGKTYFVYSKFVKRV